jgi:hypothetical protein
MEYKISVYNSCSLQEFKDNIPKKIRQRSKMNSVMYREISSAGVRLAYRLEIVTSELVYEISSAGVRLAYRLEIVTSKLVYEMR